MKEREREQIKEERKKLKYFFPFIAAGHTWKKMYSFMRLMRMEAIFFSLRTLFGHANKG